MITSIIVFGTSGEEGGKPECDAPVYGKQERLHCQDQGKHRVGVGDVGVGVGVVGDGVDDVDDGDETVRLSYAGNDEDEDEQ